MSRWCESQRDGDVDRSIYLDIIDEDGVGEPALAEDVFDGRKRLGRDHDVGGGGDEAPARSQQQLGIGPECHSGDVLQPEGPGDGLVRDQEDAEYAVAFIVLPLGLLVAGRNFDRSAEIRVVGRRSIFRAIGGRLQYQRFGRHHQSFVVVISFRQESGGFRA